MPETMQEEMLKRAQQADADHEVARALALEASCSRTSGTYFYTSPTTLNSPARVARQRTLAGGGRQTWLRRFADQSAPPRTAPPTTPPLQLGALAGCEGTQTFRLSARSFGGADHTASPAPSSRFEGTGNRIEAPNTGEPAATTHTRACTY